MTSGHVLSTVGGSQKVAKIAKGAKTAKGEGRGSLSTARRIVIFDREQRLAVPPHGMNISLPPVER